MGLKEQLADDLKTAMRAGEKDRVGAVRLLRAAIQNAEVARTDPKNAAHGQAMTDADYLAVIQKEIKQRQDSIEQFERGARADLVAREQIEIDVLRAYLPRQLSRDELVAEIGRLVEREGRDFRKVMPLAARELRGKADGRLVNEVVKELTQ